MGYRFGDLGEGGVDTGLFEDVHDDGVDSGRKGHGVLLGGVVDGVLKKSELSLVFHSRVDREAFRGEMEGCCKADT